MYLRENISLTGNIKIEMTKGVTTKHILEKKDKYGEIELQEMCFYLENKFQVRMVIKVLRKLIMKQNIQETLGYSEAVPVPTDPKVCINMFPVSLSLLSRFDHLHPTK